MSIVIIAEKPSQGKAYCDAFHNTSNKGGYIEVNDKRYFDKVAYITWGFGHLVELVQPEQYNPDWKSWSLQTLPIIPSQFKYQPSKSSIGQYNIVKKLLKNATEIVIASDIDREGEAIARLIINQAGADHLPMKRLWINSLEVSEVQKGFKNLKNGDDYLNLFKEAETRQKSDWLVGINATRLITAHLQNQGLTGFGAWSSGRVQTPTLFLINKRQSDIKYFQAKPFHEIFGDVKVSAGEFEAKSKGRFDSLEELSNLLNSHGVILGENSGIIKSIEQKSKVTLSPQLHSLSSLQTVANRKWKYSPTKTLEFVQKLYEAKVISYPRTDSQFITDSEFAYIKENLESYKEVMGVDFDTVYLNARKRYVDGSKVEEHYALVPTKNKADISKLSTEEKNIYTEIVLTTLAMFMGDYKYDETKVEVDVKGLLFEKTGRVERDEGWKVLFKDTEKKQEGENNTVLPVMNNEEQCNVFIKTKEGITKPPKPYTEGQLIQVMKSAGRDMESAESKKILKDTEGIGTEATRANIIETLKHQKYIEVKKNTVFVTPKGELLCKVVDGSLLASAEMTAKWESYLATIGKGKGSQDAFLRSIEKFLHDLINSLPKKIDAMKMEFEGLVQNNSIGACPSCNIGNINDKGKFYGCDKYREGCKFTLPKKFLGKTISPTNIKKLLDGEKTNLIKGFKGKKGSFDAHLKVVDGQIKFESPKRK